jgi:hypothetical protein
MPLVSNQEDHSIFSGNNTRSPSRGSSDDIDYSDKGDPTNKPSYGIPGQYLVTKKRAPGMLTILIEHTHASLPPMTTLRDSAGYTSSSSSASNNCDDSEFIGGYASTGVSYSDRITRAMKRPATDSPPRQTANPREAEERVHCHNISNHGAANKRPSQYIMNSKREFEKLIILYQIIRMYRCHL